ncbi:MAG: hypothetical protein ABIG89_01090 [Candidatus Woesearchaeota archaeon]
MPGSEDLVNILITLSSYFQIILGGLFIYEAWKFGTALSGSSAAAKEAEKDAERGEKAAEKTGKKEEAEVEKEEHILIRMDKLSADITKKLSNYKSGSLTSQGLRYILKEIRELDADLEQLENVEGAILNDEAHFKKLLSDDTLRKEVAEGGSYVKAIGNMIEKLSEALAARNIAVGNEWALRLHQTIERLVMKNRRVIAKLKNDLS